MTFHELFERRPPLIAMIHLLPLPGSPRWAGDTSAVEHQARVEASVLVDAGADGLIVENYGDAPFHKNRVDAVTTAFMAVLVRAVRDETRDAVPIGVNVLRNDVLSALSVASASGGAFVRVNVHVGAMVTDQGIIEGDAARTLRERVRIAPDVLIFADVWVKHATPLGGSESIEQTAAETYERGLADALILSGTGTGQPTDPTDLRAVRRRTPEASLLVGSGATVDTLGGLLSLADGVIVGSALKADGAAANTIDPERVRAFFSARPAS